MKKILGLLIFSFFFVLTIKTSAKAQTYEATELTSGQHLCPGDVITFGPGHFMDFTQQDQNYVYVSALIYDGHNSADIGVNSVAQLFHFSNGRTYTFTEDMYVTMEPLISNHGSSVGQHLCLSLRFAKFLVTKEVNNIQYSGYSENVTVNKSRNETISVSIHPEGGIPPYEYEWQIAKDSYRTEHFITNENHFELSDDIYTIIDCLVWDSTKNSARYACGKTGWVIVLPTAEPDDEEKIESNNNDNDREEKPKEPTVPSTLPENTVQVSFGDNDSTLTDVKVLNQYLHDSINQKLIADLYATKMKKRASIIMQKNLHAPYCAERAWKKSSHKVRWNNLNVKSGDNIVIVWYTPTYFGLVPTLQTIPATVIEDGVIEFTIPYMGDMSVMSIVKLI